MQSISPSSRKRSLQTSMNLPSCLHSSRKMVKSWSIKKLSIQACFCRKGTSLYSGLKNLVESALYSFRSRSNRNEFWNALFLSESYAEYVTGY